MAGSSRKVIKFVCYAREKQNRGTGKPVPRLYGGVKMISAWYLIPAVLFGVLVGITFIALCSAGRTNDERDDNNV